MLQQAALPGKKRFDYKGRGGPTRRTCGFNRKFVKVGFKPQVYGNLKVFPNPNPTPDEMVYWAEKQGISVEQVTGATEGIKIQIEQVFVTNGLGLLLLNRVYFLVRKHRY